MKAVALVGAGRMGSVHGRSLVRHPRLHLAYLVDPDAARRRELAGATGAAEASYEQALADPRVEGVVIASSTDRHLEHTLQALRAGKAVFCEKPLDLELARLEAARAELTAPGVRLFVGFNRRFDTHFRALRARIVAGEIGTLESLHIVNHDPASPPAEFLPGSGGLFRDFTIHDFDMASWLLQEPPTEVFASASCLVDPRIADVGDVDTAKLILRTQTRRLCTISNTRRTGFGYDQRIEAYGSAGSARIGNVALSTVSVLGKAGCTSEPPRWSFAERYADAYRAEMDHFADILEARAPAEAGYADNVRALSLALAAAESARTGRMVRA
jgi:myo-inositol 2-dehydrogenase/D-chiro-inositol 1-dehydrogenase